MAIEILSDETIIVLIIASSKELLKNPHFTDGLDIKGTAKIRNILKSYAQSGCTILISSHIAGEIQCICTKVAVMMNGKIIDKSSITTAIMEYGSVEDYYLHIVNQKEAAE